MRHGGAVEALAEGCCGYVKLAQVLGRLSKYYARSWLGNSEQADHSRLRKFSGLEIVRPWRASGWEIVHVCLAVTLGHLWVLLAPCLQLGFRWKEGCSSTLLLPGGLALSARICLWTTAEEGLTGNVPL